MCGKSFTRKSSLNDHTQSVHDVTMTNCEYMVTSPNHLHMSVHLINQFLSSFTQMTEKYTGINIYMNILGSFKSTFIFNSEIKFDNKIISPIQSVPLLPI
jgi:hypothetical protein